MSTAARARRPPHAAQWLTQVAQLNAGPAPWAQMGHAALAIAVPMGVGVATRNLVPGILAGAGGLLPTMADRTGPYLQRARRAVAEGIFGGAAGC